jgi:flagellar hook protein FlgE
MPLWKESKYMALTSTLFTGLSGLNVNQTRLNVVGNNIANVNTVAFKASRALFKPQFYVTDSGGTPADDTFGGSNPSQRGLGAVVATIEKDFSAGSIEPTGKPTDLAIEGDGFFVVQGKDQKFTRDGSFNLNEANQLVTTSGDFVQGYGVDVDQNVQVGQLQNITIPLGSLTQAEATEKATFQGNLNANGAIATGASILDSGPLTTDLGALPDATTPLVNLRDPADLATPLFAPSTLTLAGKRGGRNLSPLTFDITGTSTLGELQAFFNQGMTLDSTVTPAAGTSLTPLATDPATVTRLRITGNVGKENALSLTGSAFSNSANTLGLAFTDDVASNPSGESVSTSFVAYDSLGTPLNINVTAVLESKADTGNTWRFYATSAQDTDAAAFDPTATSHPGAMLGTGTMTFDSDGKLISSTNASLQINRDNTGSGSPLNMAIDFSKMTSLASTESNLTATEVDGSPIGTLSSFTIGANGIITGSFDNGLTRTLGQVAMATFNNPMGLQDVGGNMYTSGANSGEPIVTSPLQLGAGSVRAGALELSNVDLSKEFINLIIASTGFSASSRVITTSDQLLTELLNTSR